MMIVENYQPEWREEPEMHAFRARSIRIGGAVTTIRLENVFWAVLSEISHEHALSLSQLVSRTCQCLASHPQEIPNKTSHLRVLCMKYLLLKASGTNALASKVVFPWLHAASI